MSHKITALESHKSQFSLNFNGVEQYNPRNFIMDGASDVYAEICEKILANEDAERDAEYTVFINSEDAETKVAVHLVITGNIIAEIPQDVKYPFMNMCTGEVVRTIEDVMESARNLDIWKVNAKGW